MDEEVARRELSEFLKHRRARLSPQEVGLPSGNGRRIKGLRREEVAALAGVGLTWYTWLEQGRAIKVSTPFLQNLARALRLSEAERQHLFMLAQSRLPPAVMGAGQDAAPRQFQSILDVIDSPAYLRNGRFDVLAWNAANTRMFGDFAAIPVPERNIVRRMFARAHYRRTMPNWEADARGIVAKFRVNYGASGGAPEFSSLVAELMELSPDFRRIWADHEVTNVGEGVYLYRSARHGLLSFQHSTLVLEGWPDLRLVIYAPVS